MKKFFAFLFFKLFLKMVTILLIVSFSIPSFALTPADAAYWNMNRTLSGTVAESIAKRGYPATDPRVANTLARMAPNLQRVASGSVAILKGAVSGRAWASIAVAIGVGQLLNRVIDLALGGTKWSIRPDGLIDISATTSTVDTSTPMVQGSDYWRNTSSGSVLAAKNPEAITRQAYDLVRKQPGNSSLEAVPVCGYSVSFPGAYTCTAWSISFPQTSGAPVSCPAGTYANGTQCVGYAFPSPTTPAQTGRTLQQAIDAIPAEDLNKQLNPDLIAALADEAWRSAAEQPGYDGLPYPSSNPITGDDVSKWIASNPTTAPTVSNFVEPRPDTTAAPNPWTTTQNPTAPVFAPTPAPNTNTTNPAAPNPIVNLGADPATPPPTLEAIPTPPEILAPILELMPNLKNFSPNTSTGTCPTPSFQFLDRTHTLTAHCTLIQNNKPIMQAAMSFAWAVMAMFILLSA